MKLKKKKHLELFHGLRPEHFVCSRLTNKQGSLERRHTQMDLTTMEYSHYFQMNQDLSLNITMEGRRFTENNLDAPILGVSVMSEQVTIVVL